MSALPEWVRFAAQEIRVNNSVNANPTFKTTLKFGQNAAVGTSEVTIMQLAGSETAETFVGTNAIDRVVSSSASDTDQTLAVTGHTISGSDLTRVIQNVSLNGQTAATLTTPLARVERMAVTAGSDLVGTVYICQDVTITAGVPQTDSAIHAQIVIGNNQTLKASSSTASNEYIAITRVYGHINEKTAAAGILKLKTRVVGAPFRTLVARGFGSGAGLAIEYAPYLIIAPNSDIVMTCEADGAATDISAGYDYVFFEVES